MTVKDIPATEVPTTERRVALLCEKEQKIRGFHFKGLKIEKGSAHQYEIFACETCDWQRVYGVRR